MSRRLWKCKTCDRWRPLVDGWRCAGCRVVHLEMREMLDRLADG